MSGVLDLAKVLQFVKDCLDQGTATQNGFLKFDTGHRLHVFSERGDELKILPDQCFSQLVNKAAFIGK